MSISIEESSILNKEAENTLNEQMPTDHERIEALEKQLIVLEGKLDKKLWFIIGLSAMNAVSFAWGSLLA